MGGDGAELSMLLEKVCEKCPQGSASSRSSSNSSTSSHCGEENDLPELDAVQHGRLAGELADCVEDFEVLKRDSFQSLLKPLHQEQTRMMRRRSTIHDLLGTGDLTSIVVAHDAERASNASCVTPVSAPSSKRTANKPANPELSKSELDLRRQVRERLRKRRETVECRGSGSLIFAKHVKPPGWKDGGDDELDERPHAGGLSKAEQLQTGRRMSTFTTMVGRNFLLGRK